MQSLRRALVWASLTAIPGLPAMSQATECSVKSPQQRVALLELYTSEGCSSCPPADKWLGELKSRGIGAEQVLPLSMHVDYWNYIGWKDPYSGPQYTQRQREIAYRNRLRTIYTPQLVLNGQDYRGWRRQNIKALLEELNKRPAAADIGLQWTKPVHGSDSVDVTIMTKLAEGESASGATLFLAVYENALVSKVEAGENDGRVLTHDYVVREMYAMPLTKASFTQQVKVELGKDWNRANIGFGVFIQNRRSGDILQAVSTGLGCQA